MDKPPHNLYTRKGLEVFIKFGSTLVKYKIVEILPDGTIGLVRWYEPEELEPYNQLTGASKDHHG